MKILAPKFSGLEAKYLGYMAKFFGIDGAKLFVIVGAKFDFGAKIFGIVGGKVLGIFWDC